ncbi:MAG: hypothetical protein USCAAHI_01172 [Beijerinckiaceae bacterium]|nr:MAG: hypothetical protein USCAAHI_01172 [Beijerinckiaceae bacterium]
MIAEFLPFFPIAIKPLIALGVDTSSPSFTRFGLHRLLIASERLKRARTFASLSKSTPRCLPNLSATSAAIGPCHTLDGGAG